MPFPKILLVEDEEAVRSMLKAVLEDEGYHVQEASNGKEALQSHASSSPDLILTDIVMPDIEGIEMIMKLRKSDPKVKIVAMSGGDYLTIAKKLGADHVLAKPFSHQTLLEALKAMLQ
jgi:YesN/AraC family two-component response regulator